MTGFETFVKKKLREKYADDKNIEDALVLVSKVFELSEGGTNAIEEELKSKVEEILRSAADDLEKLKSVLEED
jgi:hypothetical protein